MKELNNIPKKNNFSVPDGYFDELNDKIIKNTNLHNESKLKSPYEIFKPYIYMAASIIILVVGIKAGLNILVDNPKINNNIEISNSDYYYEDMISDLIQDEVTLFEFIMDTDNEPVTGLVNEENYDYVEDYLASYYLEYELLYD